MPLWQEAHFEVNILVRHNNMPVWSTLESSAVGKVHVAAARRTFVRQER